MTNTKNQLAVMPTEEVAQRLQEVVLSVTGTEGLTGFKKAYMMAEGIKKLKEILTPEYMAPIMELQGSKLGFRTDKDIVDYKPGPGYPIEIVKSCVIEAVLNGLQVTGNQFNIIAGNMYPTKEGTGYILNNFKGLKYQIICALPRMNNEGTSAAVDVSIKWDLNGEHNEEVVPIPIRVNKAMGIDAIIGKATRKGRAWLISRITGSEITDGEIEDASHTVVVSVKEKTDDDIENQRWLALFKEATSIEELEYYQNGDFPKTDVILQAYQKRFKELSAKK